MNFLPLLFITLMSISVTLPIVFWYQDEQAKERANGYRIKFRIRSWIWQCVIKVRSDYSIGDLQKWSAASKKWQHYHSVYKVRKLAPNYYECGCFRGTYDEMIERNNRAWRRENITDRPQILKDYYLRQLAKASR